MTQRVSRSLLAAAVVGAIALTVPLAALGQTTVSAGASVRVLTGTFGGTETTHVVLAPFVLRADVRRFELSVTVPFLKVDSGTVALSQAGFIPMQGSMSSAPSAGMPMGGGGMMGRPWTGGTAPGTITAVPFSASGPGDVVASAGYRVVDHSFSGVQVVVGARVKLPTADSTAGLGTGKTDVAGVVTLRKRYDGGWMYVEGGYLAVGKAAGADLSNVALWSAGVGRHLAGRYYALASAAGSTAVVAAFGSPAEIGAGLGVKLGERLALTVLPSIGLSNASPKYGVTVGISSDLLRR